MELFVWVIIVWISFFISLKLYKKNKTLLPIWISGILGVILTTLFVIQQL